MYSYSFNEDEDLKGVVASPVFDTKTKQLFESRGIYLSASMKDYYSFINSMVTLGVLFPNASGRTAKPKVRDTFNKEQQFILKDYGLEEITYDEMVDSMPEFLAYINFVKFCQFIKTVKDKKLKIVDTVATTEISYVNNTIHLFNIMRGMTSGKIVVETPHGTVFLDTVKVDDCVVEPLRNKVDDTDEIFSAVTSHLETIRSAYIEKEKKIVEKLNKRLASIRSETLRDNWRFIQECIKTGYTFESNDNGFRLVWKGKINVEKVTINKSYLTNNPKDSEQLTIPLPKSITEDLYVKGLWVYVDTDMKIIDCRGDGRHPHLTSGSFCIGSALGSNVSVAPSLIHSLSTCYAGSFAGGAGCEEVRDYLSDVRRVYNDGGDLSEFGLSKSLKSEVDSGDFGTVFGKINKDEGGRPW